MPLDFEIPSTRIRFTTELVHDMRDRNMLTQVYSTSVKDADYNLMQKQWTEWSSFNTLGPNTLRPSQLASETDLWLPTKEWIWRAGGGGDVPSTTLDDLVFTYNIYDEHGQIKANSRMLPAPLQLTHGIVNLILHCLRLSQLSLVGTTLTSSATYEV